MQIPVTPTHSIAAKIFGLAAFLLVMTIALTCFLLWNVYRIESSLDRMAQHDVPLAQAIANIDYTALRRRLEFERWFGALNANPPNEHVANEASKNYEIYAKKLREEALQLRQMLDDYPADEEMPTQMIEVRLLFDQLVTIYPVLTKQMMAVLELQKAGEREKANAQLILITELQNSVQATREKMAEKMSSLSVASAKHVAGQQVYTFWIALAATVSTLLLGLILAWIIAGNLTRPMRTLVAAMGRVRTGDLAIEKLPVFTRDEVGQLTDTFNYFLEELRAKEMIKSTFGKYIDPRVLEHVLLAPDGAMEDTSRRIMTVSFADIVGFSGLSERLTPTAMVAVLNRHFELQAQMVHTHQGVVDKFIGDAVMTFWGPPFVKAEEQAMLACKSALAQIAIIDTLRTELPDDITGLRKDTPQIDIRIGLCSGDVVVGSIGSDSSRSYTVIGDTVNLASRLEGTNRIYGTHILVSESTRTAIGNLFCTREIDLITVKGRAEPSRIYELLGETATVPADRLRLRDCHENALAAYRVQDWDKAEALWNDCLRINPDDAASRVFLQRVATLREQSPGADWDGVWHMTDK